MKTNTEHQSIGTKLLIGYALVAGLIAALYLVVDALRMGGAAW